MPLHLLKRYEEVKAQFKGAFGFEPFHFHDLISNSLSCLLYNSYDVAWENLVWINLQFVNLLFFFILTSCLIDIV